MKSGVRGCGDTDMGGSLNPIKMYGTHKKFNKIYFKKVFLYFMSMSMCLSRRTWPERPEEGVRSLRTGVIGSGESTDMGAGNQPGSSATAASALN